jgi:hypothetical protein
MKLRDRLLYIYRHLLSRCLLCGRKKNHRPKSERDLYSRYPNPRFCRPCNKNLVIGKAYGLASDRLRPTVERRG